MLPSFLGGLGDDRHVQAAADSFSDLAERYTLFGHRMIPGSRRTLLERQSVESGRIENAHRRPATEPVAHVRRDTLLARFSGPDQRGDQCACEARYRERLYP